MDTELFTISFGNVDLDDDFTFYQSGKVKHKYDKSGYSLNHVDWHEAHQLSASTKQELLHKCSDEFKDQLKALLQI